MSPSPARSPRSSLTTPRSNSIGGPSPRGPPSGSKPVGESPLSKRTAARLKRAEEEREAEQSRKSAYDARAQLKAQQMRKKAEEKARHAADHAQTAAQVNLVTNAIDPTMPFPSAARQGRRYSLGAMFAMSNPLDMTRAGDWSSGKPSRGAKRDHNNDFRIHSEITHLKGTRSSRHKDAITSVAFSPDAQAIASCSADGSILIWDAYTHKLRAEVDPGSFFSGGPPISCSYSGDSAYLATCHQEGLVLVWNVHMEIFRREKEAGIMISKVSSPEVTVNEDYELSCCSFSFNSKRLACAGRKGVFSVWAIDFRRKSAHRMSKGRQDGQLVYTIAWSPNSRQIATGTYNALVHVWEVKGLKQLHTLGGHDGAVRQVQFSPNGQFILSGSEDGKVLLWNLATPSSPTAIIGDHGNWVLTCAFASRGFRVISGCRDHRVRIYDIAEAIEEVGCVEGPGGFLGWINATAASPNGRQIACGNAQGDMMVFFVPALVAAKSFMNIHNKAHPNASATLPAQSSFTLPTIPELRKSLQVSIGDSEDADGNRMMTPNTGRASIREQGSALSAVSNDESMASWHKKTEMPVDSPVLTATTIKSDPMSPGRPS